MVIVKIFTMLVSGYASLFVVAWTVIVLCIGLSWVVSWQEYKR